MKNRFDLIIFDWDGTLIDSIDWIARCLQNAANNTRHAIPDYQAAKDVIGLSIERAIEALYSDANSDEVLDLVQRYETAYFSKKISRDDLFSNVYEMLNTLKKENYLLAIATGKTREGLDEALSATNTRDLFCITRCADETQSKPHPLMLEEIMQYTKISPERTLMVGDSTHDLQMALNAGVASIGVASGAHDFTQLKKYQPLHCFLQSSELLQHFI
ncbi:MAG: HAD-IA family hydrolase [Methylococcales bacterium]|nr:HAD-IA family hydrolase [Methylococcales bacterium]MDD5753881.1 HAD-IA family hydrolase [Methylococcales bacterium]